MEDAEPKKDDFSQAFREELPPDCPPADAIEIVEDITVFRLVQTAPATDEDFRSLRDLKPKKPFPDLSECQLKGLSVHKDKSDSRNLLKLPNLRNRLIYKVTLRTGAGKIKQTNKPSHHTWWPFAGYDILTNCEIENS